MGRKRKAVADPLWLKWDYLRKVNGYSNTEWCGKLGITYQTWYRYSQDSNKATLATIRRMSEVLHIPASEVVA